MTTREDVAKNARVYFKTHLSAYMYARTLNKGIKDRPRHERHEIEPWEYRVACRGSGYTYDNWIEIYHAETGEYICDL